MSVKVNEENYWKLLNKERNQDLEISALKSEISKMKAKQPQSENLFNF